MISDRYHGSIRLHLLIKLAGGLLIFWAIVWVLHAGFYREELLPVNYLWVSFLVPCAAVFEFLIRAKRHHSLSGLTRQQVWSVT